MKVRVDQFLVDKGFFETREKAKRAIISGIVRIEGYDKLKPGMRIEDNAKVIVKGKKEVFPYVSRGGLKLEKALREFNISVKGKVAMDVGASTGGFTDCLLRFGAEKVYAIDVGYGQLDWKLRNDPRVIVRERVNARYLTKEIVEEEVDIATLDVSFISVEKILPSIKECLKTEGDLVILIKPQFEAGREDVKKGIVRDPLIHERVVNKLIASCREFLLIPWGITWSPIKGPKGNIEFLLWCKNDVHCRSNIEESVKEIVEEAHRRLD